jgi:hypothetical protein
MFKQTTKIFGTKVQDGFMDEQISQIVHDNAFAAFLASVARNTNVSNSKRHKVGTSWKLWAYS